MFQQMMGLSMFYLIEWSTHPAVQACVQTLPLQFSSYLPQKVIEYYNGSHGVHGNQISWGPIRIPGPGH
jgi:hypothetical protein